MMEAVHELPGATFCGPRQRGSYGSDATAALTVRELERWLALAVATYHGQLHGGLGCTPAGRWAEGVAATGIPATVTSEAAFLVDFLPGEPPDADQDRLRHRPRALPRRAQAVNRSPRPTGPVRDPP